MQNLPTLMDGSHTLILKVYNIDLVNPKYLKCINWKIIEEIIPDIEEHAKTYKSWHKVEEIINEVKQRITGQREY